MDFRADGKERVMRFETAIEHLVDNYRYAKSKVWIRDEVAWALYHTWKEADDRKTEPTISKMEQVEDEPQFDYCPRCGMRILVDKPTDEPQTCDYRCVQTEVGCERTDCQWK